ncbi:hypothetical protein UPYG_G00017300 [Umbra pygmaea]|uniref:Protein aurora borealis n=1 Tax=Umbra pygmaea TaxID=75934 RepID=A0ABD0XJW6_UMBPY
MGDHLPELQITPETPGRPAVRNPFESPNDYHHLHEPVVLSPSVFRSFMSSTPPAKFKWDIDEMASLLPVHIDAEEIHRQSMYLSQTRMDSDIEAKRQSAIEQFFTKGTVVPSPWSGQSNKKISSQMHFGKSPLSPLILEEPLPTKKTTVACQTLLSLPETLDLEKILGAYYRSEVGGQDQQEQFQENLSCSSLRRKLFLDGHGSGSESSSPPSPERAGTEGAPPRGGVGGDTEFLLPFTTSPLPCPAALTPSTGQFSSSPIQGRHCDYSLGSITSPLFPERSSPAGLKSPDLSPIGPDCIQTPRLAERKKLSFVTPEGVPLDADMNSCTVSPYIDGCSPIRSCSPLQRQANSCPKPRIRARCWGSPPLISPILNPLHDQENIQPFTPPLTMELDSCSPGLGVPRNSGSLLDLGKLCEGTPGKGLALLESVKMEEVEDEEVVDIPEEEEGVCTVGVRLTSSRMGESVMTVETGQTFVSLLAEGSIIPYDNSMQVDSGYSTYAGTATASLIDAMSSESQSKESFDAAHVQDETFQTTSRHSKTKTVFSQHH